MTVTATRTIQFVDRADAGRQLARRLEHLRGQDMVVLGLPRGGVPVAFEVAKELKAPLDVIVVAKLGLPHHSEVAMGAIGEGGFDTIDRHIIARERVSRRELARTIAWERSLLEGRVERLRRGRPRVDLHGRTAVIVDDGLATGASARVACDVARYLGASKVVLAVPVGPRSTVEGFVGADEVVCVHTPHRFWAVGQHYRDFSPTTENDVLELLNSFAHQVDTPVAIPAGGSTLHGDLVIPPGATGLVVFAHGSGSSRHSVRNRYVARVLNHGGFGTLLLDLLSPYEERDRTNVFNIGLLADRVTAAVTWVRARPDTGALPLGLFGASTGAGAALWAASDPGLGIDAVVSRGGRPDLAGERLWSVTAPTLLIVGGADKTVLEMNRKAQARLGGPSRLAVVPGATHLFEEPGALLTVARWSRRWFEHFLTEGTVTVDVEGL